MFRPGEEIDIKQICRAANVYYKILQNHCLGVIQLPEDTIKFMTERLLEQVLILEEVSKQVYEYLPEDVKELLAQQEQSRNNSVYFDSHGNPLKNCDHAAIQTCIDNAQSRYDSIRDKAEERVNTQSSAQI